MLKYSPNATTDHQYCIHHKFVNAGADEGTYVPLEYEAGDLKMKKNGWSFKDNILKPANKGETITAIRSVKPKKNSEKEQIANYLQQKSPHWLDLEIAFSRKNIDGKIIADRIDLAVIDSSGDIPILRLIEVKTANDRRLCAKDKVDVKTASDPKHCTKDKNKLGPEIFCQMERYKEFICDQKEELKTSYRTVAQNMLDLGLGQIDRDLLECFATKGEIDDFPHLLVIGDIKKLEKKDHWGKLCTWLDANCFPEPISI